MTQIFTADILRFDVLYTHPDKIYPHAPPTVKQSLMLKNWFSTCKSQHSAVVYLAQVLHVVCANTY